MITRNSASKAPGLFARVLESVAWADEIIIVDAASGDATPSIAAQYTDKVFIHPWPGSFRLQRERALSYATCEWVLWIDDDEIVPAALAEAIRAALRRPAANAFWLGGVHYFLGRPLQHCGWARKLRIWRRGVGGFRPENVHERYVVAGAHEELQPPLEHHSTPGLRGRLEKQIFIAETLAAQFPGPATWSGGEVWRRMIKPSLGNFYQVFWCMRGYRDGIAGLIWAVTWALEPFYAAAFQWAHAQAEQESRSPTPGNPNET